MKLIALLLFWLVPLVLLFYAHTNTLRLLFLSVLSALLFFPLAFVSMIAWTFRDGIGIGSVSSEGWDAWALFFQDIWSFLLLVAVFVVAGYFANRSAHKRIEANGESQSSILEL